MGLEVGGQGAIYLGVYEGTITQRIKDVSKANTSATNYRKRMSGGDTPTEIHEYTYRSLTGQLKKVVFKPAPAGSKFKAQLELHVTDGEANYVLQMGQESGYAIGFLKSIQSIDNLGKPITFTPYAKKVDDRIKVTMFLKEFGKTERACCGCHLFSLIRSLYLLSESIKALNQLADFV